MRARAVVHLYALRDVMQPPEQRHLDAACIRHAESMLSNALSSLDLARPSTMDWQRVARTLIERLDKDGTVPVAFLRQ